MVKKVKTKIKLSKSKINPTEKQKRAVRALVESGGTISKAKALASANYSKSMIRNPQRVFESPVVKDYLNEILPDDYIYKKTQELIEARSIRILEFTPDTTTDEIRKALGEVGGKIITTKMLRGFDDKGKSIDKSKIVYASVPSNTAKKNGIDIACKIKGTYAPEKKLNANFDFSELSDEELEEKIAEAEKINARAKMYKKE